MNISGPYMYLSQPKLFLTQYPDDTIRNTSTGPFCKLHKLCLVGVPVCGAKVDKPGTSASLTVPRHSCVGWPLLGISNVGK